MIGKTLKKNIIFIAEEIFIECTFRLRDESHIDFRIQGIIMMLISGGHH